MSSVIRLMAVTGASVLALAGAAFADPPRQLSVGQTVNGVLAQGDARNGDNAFYEEYSVRLDANQSIEALMKSSAFDAFLHVGRGTGDAFEELKSDDDSGGGEKGTDARVRFKAPQAGVYTVRVRTLNDEMSGAYSLSVKPYTPPPPAVARSVSYGDNITGHLANGGSRLEDSDRLYDVYTFHAAAGDRVRLDAVSSDFDAMLDFGRIKNGEFESLKDDDDGGGDKNARLMTVIEEAGDYTVRVLSFDKNGEGAYTFDVAKLPPPAPEPRPKAIRVNQIMKGSFSDASPTFEEFRPYDYYVLQGSAGQKVTINLRSSNFDTFLDVGVMSPGGYAVIKSDDDSGGDTNSKIDFTFKESGRVIIRASGLRAGMTGDYSISVE